MRSAYIGNEFTIPGFGLSFIAVIGIGIWAQSCRISSAAFVKESLAKEYESAAARGKEHYITTLRIHYDRMGDLRDCSFFGADLDGDRNDDILKERTHLGRGMFHTEYRDLRCNR